MTDSKVLQSDIVSHGSFDTLRNSKFFVDDSKKIQGCLSRRWRETKLLIKGKRGFGKTTTLDMIRRFAEIDVHPNGSIINLKRKHKNYKTFAEIVPSTGKFLEVYEQKYFFGQYFGAYPVIWIDLDTKGVKTYDEESYARLLQNGTIRSAFEDHVYLLNSAAISEQDKQQMRNFLSSSIPNCSHREEHVRARSPCAGIKLLKKLLFVHFQRSAIVLVDNVDAPLREVILDPEQHTELAFGKLYMLAGLIEAIPASDTAARVPAPFRTIMSATFEPYHVLEWYLWQGCPGFDESQMKSLVKSANLELEMERILTWYGGHGEIRAKSLNPYSFIRFLSCKTKEFKPFWPELSSLETFKVALLPECFGQIIMECLVSCEFTKAVDVNLQMSLENTKKLKALQMLTLPISSYQCTVEDLRIFIVYLVGIGYLNLNGRIGRVADVRRKLKFQTFSIPNLEVKTYVAQMLYEAAVSKTALNGNANFRLELLAATCGVDGSLQSMCRFADALVTLLVASERGSGGSNGNGTLAHSLRAHFLHPPPQFQSSVKYVKTSRNAKDLNEGKSLPDLDLVFIVQGKQFLTGFVMKIEVDMRTVTSSWVLNAERADIFTSYELENVTEFRMVKVVANLCCDKDTCAFSYLSSDTNLQEVKRLVTKKDRVANHARSKYNIF